jgi:hypothetical protein
VLKTTPGRKSQVKTATNFLQLARSGLITPFGLCHKKVKVKIANQVYANAKFNYKPPVWDGSLAS